MELGNYISEQLAMFLRAILLGGTLGLIYDLLRTLRRLGGRVWGGVLDGFFCVLAVSGLFLFTMAGDGELRLFVLMGALGGGVLFFCLLSRPMRPLWDFWLELLLAPAELVWRTGKKCGRRTKKSFSFCRKWVTMKGKHWRERLRPPRQEGDEEMNRAPVKEKKKAQPRQEKKRPSGKLTLLILAALLAGIGGGELYRCVGGEKDSWLAETAVFVPCCTVGWYYFQPELVSVWFILSALAVCSYAICKGGAVRFHQIAAVLFGGIAIGYAFSSFVHIYASGVSRGYLLLPFLLSFGCDTFAYFTGLALGRHKLAPRVSPHNTVEGAVGGLAGNVLCALGFAWAMNRWFGGAVPYGAMALLGLFCGAVAQVGDLSFSLIKREFGIKDYGRIFFAHGGVLDRFDSVIFVAPVLAALLELLQIG